MIASKAMEKVKTPKAVWWHWKRWSREYKRGTLDKEIDILIPDLASIPGIEFKDFVYNDKIVNIIKRDKKLYELYMDYKSNTE
jgi:hypothetical protein